MSDYKLTAYGKAINAIGELDEEITRLREKNGKLREALKSLAKHCNEMEWSQNQDYYTMGEDGIPCLSQPLVDAYNLIEDDV